MYIPGWREAQCLAQEHNIRAWTWKIQCVLQYLLQPYTDAWMMNCDIFQHDTNNYWHFDNRNKKFNVQKYLSLWLLIINKSKPFQNYLLDRDLWKGKKFHLCFVLWWRIFQVGGTKACAFPIPLHPWTKHMVHLFFTALLRLLVEMMYHIVYRIVALTSIHVSYLEKLYCCSPTLTILDRHFTTKKLKQTK